MDGIWKEVLTIDRVFDFVGTCTGFCDRDLRLCLETLLTCKQIYDESQDIIWEVNTFKITVSHEDPEDFEAARKHSLWAKIRIVHFYGYFMSEVSKDSSPHQVREEHELRIMASQVANVHNKAPFRIKRLFVVFHDQFDLAALLEHISYFSQLKVKEEASFRMSMHSDSFDLVMGMEMLEVFKPVTIRCDAGFARTNRICELDDVDVELQRSRNCANTHELGFDEIGDEETDDEDYDDAEAFHDDSRLDMDDPEETDDEHADSAEDRSISEVEMPEGVGEF